MRNFDEFDRQFARTSKAVVAGMAVLVFIKLLVLAGIGWAGYELVTWLTSK